MAEDKRVQGLVKRFSGRERSISTPPVRARPLILQSSEPVTNASSSVSEHPQVSAEAPSLAVTQEASPASLPPEGMPGGSVRSRVRSYSQRMGVPLVARLAENKVCSINSRCSHLKISLQKKRQQFPKVLQQPCLPPPLVECWDLPSIHQPSPYPC